MADRRSFMMAVVAFISLVALKIEGSPTMSPIEEEAWPAINYRAHIFYYPWYKNESFDGLWFHWGQSPDPKYTPEKVVYHPPNDIGSNFYPLLGTYSSNDSNVVDQHMRWIRSTGVGVVAISWYPPMFAPSHRANVDEITPQIFDVAAKYNLKVTFLIEKYPSKGGRKYGGETIKEVAKYIMDTYGNHSAFYRTTKNGKEYPLYYMYAANEVMPKSWRKGLQPGGSLSVRGTEYDAIFAMLFMYPKHFAQAYESGFDALFTYFSIKDYVYGSTWSKWPEITEIAKGFNMTFIPSFGPGYIDTRVRPFNAKRISGRNGGAYYLEAFQSAKAAKSEYISITSFNEWHEGSMIEPAIQHTVQDTYDPATNQTHTVFHCADYAPHPPTFYLELTKGVASDHKLLFDDE